MIRLRRLQPLKSWNTFGIAETAAYGTVCTRVEQLHSLRRRRELHGLPLLPLGAGSNVLFAEPFPGVVVRVRLRGIRCVAESAHEVLVEAAAGEPWHNFVRTCLTQGWYGLENLALIPGMVGAAPVHNIGAYGVEVAEFLDGVEFWEHESGQFLWLPAAELGLGYRSSRLRTELLGRGILTRVRFRLLRRPRPHAQYPTLAALLERERIRHPTPWDIFHAVCRLRRQRLPDPRRLPNAGSFFRNPIVPARQAQELRQRYPELPLFPAGADSVKIPAAWLIEQCGWKGYRRGDVGVAPQHALVLVNYGGASGREILQLVQEIARSVWERFQIRLEPEVLILPAQAWQP